MIFKKESFSLSRKRIVFIAGILTALIFGLFLYIAFHLKISRTSHYTYGVLAKELRKRGEMALKAGSYTVARRFFERAMFFANSGKLFSLERELRKILEGSEELKKIGQGMVPFQGAWVKKEEFLRNYENARKTGEDLVMLNYKATAAIAEGNYAEATLIYEEIIKKYDEASWLIGSEFDRDKLMFNYRKALLLKEKKKGDKLFDSRAFEEAAALYIGILKNMQEYNLKEIELCGEIQSSLVNAFIESAVVKLTAQDWHGSKEMLDRAREELFLWKCMQSETMDKLEAKITEVFRRLYFSSIKQCQNFISGIIYSGDVQKTCSVLEYVINIFKLFDNPNRLSIQMGSSELCAQERHYRILEVLITGIIEKLQKDRSFYNFDEIKNLETLFQNTLSLVRDRIEKEQAARNEFADKLIVLEERAKRSVREGKYEESLRLYDEAIRFIRSSPFRGEVKYVAKIEELNAAQNKITEEIKRGKKEKILTSMEQLLMEGKLEEAVRISRDLHQIGDLTDATAKRILWLRDLAQNMRVYFADEIKGEAVPFFSRLYRKELKIKIEDISIQKLSGRKVGSQCFEFCVLGLANIYIETSQRLAAYPFTCEVNIKTCYDLMRITHQSLKCRENKVKSSLGQEPIFFGTQE